VLFTDIAVANMNGIAFAKIVSERWPHVGIVVTSRGAPRRHHDGGLAAGRALSAKPYSVHALVREIEAVLPQVGAPVALTSLPSLPRQHARGWWDRSAALRVEKSTYIRTNTRAATLD
jgi:DNA-binding response OmpR family regulator